LNSSGMMETGRVQVTEGRAERYDPSSQPASNATRAPALRRMSDQSNMRPSRRPASPADDVLLQSAYSRIRQRYPSELEALRSGNINTHGRSTLSSNVVISPNRRAASDSKAQTLNNTNQARPIPNQSHRQASYQGPSHPSHAAIQRQKPSMEHPLSSLNLPTALERPPLTPSPGLSSTATAPSVQTTSPLSDISDREDTPPRERRRRFLPRNMPSVVFGER
jgi:hypothetical protein